MSSHIYLFMLNSPKCSRCIFNHKKSPVPCKELSSRYHIYIVHLPNCHVIQHVALYQAVFHFNNSREGVGIWDDKLHFLIKWGCVNLVNLSKCTLILVMQWIWKKTLTFSTGIELFRRPFPSPIPTVLFRPSHNSSSRKFSHLHDIKGLVNRILKSVCKI